MPFSGLTYEALNILPHSGPIKAHLRDIARALTFLRTNSGGAITDFVSGTPGVNQIPKWTGTEAEWRDDETGMAGAGEDNVQSDWNTTDNTSDTFIVGKPDVDGLIAAAVLVLNAAIALKAPIASPDLTGAPLSTTPPANDNSRRIATTAWVRAHTASVLPPAPVTQTGYMGWLDATTNVLTAAQILAGTAFSGNEVTVPARTGNGFFWFARTAYPSMLFFDGPLGSPPPTFSVLTGFTELVDVDVSGTVHNVAITNAEQNAAILGIGTFRLRFED